jgi:hypothetical protein
MQEEFPIEHYRQRCKWHGLRVQTLVLFPKGANRRFAIDISAARFTGESNRD